MDVCSSDFEAVVSQVISDIRDAEFLAIDGEFTGLYDAIPGLFDTPQERYQKLRTCVNYSLVQFGLVTFFRESDGYSHRAYDFTLFGGTLRKFMVNTEALMLITSSGFSLDKMVKEGIPFLNIEEEEKLRSKVELSKQTMAAEISRKQDGDAAIVEIPIEQSQFMDLIFSKVNKFIDSEDGELLIQDTTGFQRKLLFGHLRNRYPNLALESKAIDGSRIMKLTKRSPEDQLGDLELFEREKMEEISKKVGFSKVVQEISKSGKLLVGHNLGLDLIHTLHQFVAPVPSDYEEFKKMLKETFPKFVDTKVMASARPLSDLISDTALSNILALTKKELLPLPKLKDPEPGKGFSLSSDQLHRAGYDAFITGVVFMSMIEQLAKEGGVTATLKKTGYADFQIIRAYENKIHMSRSELKYLDIDKPEVEPDRSNTFVLTVPRHFKSPDVINLLKPLGRIDYQWVDDTTVVVAVVDKSRKNEVFNTVRSNTASDSIGITTYAEYRKKGQRRVDALAHETTSQSPRTVPLVESRSLKRKAEEPVEEAKRECKEAVADITNETPKMPKLVETLKPSLPETFETPDW